MTTFNLATLDGTGKVPASLLPAGALATVYSVASQSAMLALSSAGKGDFAIRSDNTTTYVLNATPASTLSNWVALASGGGGGGAVASVNGFTGAVVLTATDVSAIPTSQKGAASGVATLDSGSKIPAAQLPNEAIPTITSVASQSAMLALTAQVGDTAVRTDVSKVFTLSATPASTLGNWIEHLTPVSTVAGRTGAIVLTSADISGVATAADLALTNADVDALQAQTQVVLVDPGDATPAISNAIFIDKDVTYAQTHYWDVGQDGETVTTSNTSPALTSTTGTSLFRTRTPGDNTNQLLAYAGGINVIEANADASNITQIGLGAEFAQVQVGTHRYFPTLPATSTEILRLTNNAGTAGTTVRVTSAGKITLRPGTSADTYTSTLTLSAGDYVGLVLSVDHTLNQTRLRIYRNMAAVSGATPTEDTGTLGSLAVNSACQNIRQGALTTSTAWRPLIGPTSVATSTAIDIMPPQVAASTALDQLFKRTWKYQNAITYARGTADTSAVNASTVLVADSALSTAVVANAVYEYYATILYDTSLNADLKFQVNVPSGATGELSATTIGTAAGSATASVQVSTITVGTSVARGGAGNGTTVSMILSGFITTSSTAGNVSISFAQQTSDATNTVLKAGRFQKLVRIA